ncbi:MAG: Gfo/Idh/MocA family protein [bacterium]
MKEHNIGIIGLGIGKHHLGNALKNPHVESVAVADSQPELLNAVKAQHAVRAAYNSWEELLSDDMIDIVIVCLPNYLHAPVSIAAMEAGKHVLCEKPPALNSKEVRKIVDASKRTKKRWMTAFNNRFRAESKFAKERVESGDLGEILYGKAFWVRRKRISWKWFSKKEMSGGGPLMDIGVHVIDLALHLMGFPEPISVSGTTYRVLDSHDVEDIALGFVRFKGGQTLMVETTEEANIPKDEMGCQIVGEKMGLRLFPLTMHAKQWDRVTDITPQFPENSWIQNLYDELDHFLECVREDKDPICLPDQALTVARIIDGIYESGRAGKEVKLKS